MFVGQGQVHFQNLAAAASDNISVDFNLQEWNHPFLTPAPSRTQPGPLARFLPEFYYHVDNSVTGFSLIASRPLPFPLPETFILLEPPIGVHFTRLVNVYE